MLFWGIIEKAGFNGAILFGVVCSVVAAIILLLLYFFAQLSVLTVTLPMMLYIFGCGVVAPSANTSALTELRHIAGASSAVIGSSVYAVSTFCSLFIPHLNLSNLFALAIYTFSLSLTGLIGFYFLILRLPKLNQ